MREMGRPQEPFLISADFFAPRFQILLHLGHELVGDRSVDQPMVVAKSEVNDGADSDGVVALFIGNDHGLLGNATNAHDGGVRLVDDGQSEDGSELAGIGDREGRALDVLGLEFLGTSALAEISDATLQTEKIEISGVLQDGNDKSPIKRNGNTHVDVAVIADVVAIDVGINDWPLLQGHYSGTHEEWHEREACAMALLESRLELAAQVDDAGKVDLVHAMDVSAGAARLDHVLGYQLAHVRHGNEIARIRRGSCRARGGWWGRYGGCGLSRRCRGGSRLRRFLALDELHDVLFGDAAAESGAGNLGETDTMLARDLSDERRGAGFFLLVLVLRGSCGRRHRRRRGSGLLFLSCGQSGRSRRRLRGGLSWLGCGGFAIHSDRADHGIHVYRGAFGHFDLL